MIGAFWICIAALACANALLDPRGRGLQPVPASVPMTLALAESCLWALLTPFIFMLSSRAGIDRGNWIARVLLLFGIGVAVAIAVDLITDIVRFELMAPLRPPFEVAPALRVRRMWFMNEFLVYIAVLAAGFARLYFIRYRARREESMRLQAEAARLQAQLADARLAALRSQLNPHFLFNTLHAVSALVESDPRGVRRMIARLSELLRTTLEGASESEVPLRQELAFIERYVEIMRIRFEGRLEVETFVDPAVLDALVPNLILQPLVENALKHGVEKLNGTGHVEIHARRDGERTILGVRDNGPALSHEACARSEAGLGLRNTRERLAQLYGSEQSLALRAAEGGGLLAEVVLPYHTRADLVTAAVTSETS
jgi:two-component system LytT family sensor kinase